MPSISDPQKVNYLFKKNIGLANTEITGEYNTEPVIPSRWSIYTTQLFQQLIPTTAPVDLQPSAVNPPDTNVIYKCNSITYPYIAKYQVLMVPAVGGALNAFKSPYFTNVISEQLDSQQGYFYKLYATSNRNCNTLVEITKGNDALWLGDPDSGIVTFYNLGGLTTQPNYSIAGSNPPVISFYRYEGVIGPNTFQSVQYS